MTLRKQTSHMIKTFVAIILGKGYSENLRYRESYYKPTLQGGV